MEDGFPHLDETVVATARYLDTLAELTDDDVRQPSVLPGWTRAHVITHVARNADALSNVLHGARAGEVRAMYLSQEARDADIEAGASRTAAELREDAVASAGRWAQAANELHSADRENPFRPRPERDPMPVRRVGVMRRTEVEVHHADLDLGYTAADWPDDFVEHLLKRRRRELEADGRDLRLEPTDRDPVDIGSGGPVVRGATADLLWWLLGRGTGQGLACSSGQLPDLGKWA